MSQRPNCCQVSEWGTFLTESEWVAVESAILSAMRERLKRRKKLVRNDPETVKLLSEINRRLAKLSAMIEELNDDE